MTGCDQRAVTAALRARGIAIPNRGQLTTEQQLAIARDDEARRIEGLRKSQQMLGEASFLDGDDAASLYLKGRGIDTVGCNNFKTIMVAPDFNLPPGKCLLGVICDLTTLHEKPIRSVGVSMLSLTDTGEAKLVGGRKFRSIVGTPRGFGVPYGRLGPHMVVAEGIESAISALQLIEGADFAVATLSAANMPHVAIPSWVRSVTIAADNDKPGLDAATALRISLRDLMPCDIRGWPGSEGFDANDELMRRRAIK